MRKKSLILLAALGLTAAAGIVLIGGGASHATMSQRVNAWFDDLEAVNSRLFELPMWMLVLGAAAVAALGTIATERLAFGKLAWKRTVLGGLAIAAALGFALHADHRIAALEDQLNALKGRVYGSGLAQNDPPPAPAVGTQSPAKIAPVAKVSTDPQTPGAAPATPAKRSAFMFDRDAAQKSLAAVFGRVELKPVVYDQASDAVQVTLPDGPAVAYLSIINLAAPGVQVKVGGSLNAKSLTSDFAKTYGCTIAINGEAGQSPMANSGLGTWSGNFMVDGVIKLNEFGGNPRPFLSFTQSNASSFVAQAAKSRALPADAYNVIWGRLDALIDGKVQTTPERDRQPRTAMATGKDGTHLYLMVVDGRQQRYSVGFTRAQVGQFLQAFGAYNGMLCDEGGSSCMYTKQWGLVNSPSDGGERPTYTHVGVITK